MVGYRESRGNEEREKRGLSKGAERGERRVVKPKLLAPALVLAQCPPKLQAECYPILQVHGSGKIMSL